MLDGTRLATASLDGLDDAHRGGITSWDLTEDDVTSIEPRGDNGGDEELGTVARRGVRDLLLQYDGGQEG